MFTIRAMAELPEYRPGSTAVKGGYEAGIAGVAGSGGRRGSSAAAERIFVSHLANTSHLARRACLRGTSLIPEPHPSASPPLLAPSPSDGPDYAHAHARKHPLSLPLPPSSLHHSSSSCVRVLSFCFALGFGFCRECCIFRAIFFHNSQNLFLLFF